MSLINAFTIHSVYKVDIIPLVEGSSSACKKLSGWLSNPIRRKTNKLSRPR